MTDDDFSRLQSAVAGNPRGRTALFRWLLDHHDETASMIRRFGKNWAAMANGLNELGVTARNNAPVTAEMVRRTWTAVHQYEMAHKRELAALTARPSPLQSPSPAAPALPVASPEAPSPEPKFKFATMRNGGRGVSPDELRALGDPSAPADPNDPRWQAQPVQTPK